MSVVVVSWEARGLTLRCLASLIDQTDRGWAEIILVDNASHDDTVASVRRAHPSVRVVESSSNVGFAAGANVGIRHARGDIVVLLNNDAVATPGFLREIVRPFGASTTIGATTGTVLLEGHFVRDDMHADLTGLAGDGWRRAREGVELVNSTGNNVTSSGNGYDRDWLTPFDPGHPPEHSSEPFGFNGGCAALRREALDDVGLFDETLFMYYEDTDLSWRLRERGWRIVHVPSARTVHTHAASSGVRSAFFLDHNERNRLRVALLHGPWSMVARAGLRAVVRVVVGPQRGRRARVLGGVALELPRLLARRVALRRRTSVPQRTLRTFASV